MFMNGIFFEGKKGSSVFTNGNVVGVLLIYIYKYRTIMSLSQFHYVLLHLVGLHLFPFFDLSFYFSIKFKCPKYDNNFWGSIITPVSIYVSIILLLYMYIYYAPSIVPIKSDSQANGTPKVILL